MGPKYEFTGETKNESGTILHRIRRLSDGKLGGWIEKEENLSQDGNCWVGESAQVYWDAQVSGDAQVYGYARVSNNAKICDSAEVYGHTEVYGGAEIGNNAKVYDYAIVHNAKVYDNAKVYGDAKVYDNAEVCNEAKVFGYAQIYGNAKICDAEIYGNAKVFGIIKINSGKYYSGEYYEEDLSNDSPKEVIQDFIYKIDDSNKITTQTGYDSIDEFFSEPITNDIKLDTLVICTIDTKEPLIKLQKVETEDKTEFKFIVDIINENGDNFIFKSIIKSQEQLNQLIQQTIEALKNYPKFSKYVDDLENCL